MRDEIVEEYERWRRMTAGDAEIADELIAIGNDREAVADAFYGELDFGTGGLRAKIGAGTNRMNIYTVRRATLGLARWLIRRGGGGTGRMRPAVAIAWDSRRHSEIFAREAGDTLASRGVDVWMFERLTPTPILSFAVRELMCSAGIVITASHNPREYNGYKVYSGDGGQITDIAASEIKACIDAADYFDAPDAAENGVIRVIPESVLQAYYGAVLALRFARTPAAPLSIVYSPLNGTGLIPVTEALSRAGYRDITTVPAQREPDGGFPACPSPNPEDPEALRAGIELMTERRADIMLATDPDCDRVGAAVRTGESVRILTGNEVGALLFEYICKKRAENGSMPERPVAVKTIVTTEAAEDIARLYGVRLCNVLTGFKYIGERIGELESSGESERFIFGFEESCGYLSGTHARDKDAVNACLLICDMAAWYKSSGKTLQDALDALFDRYGCFATALESFEFHGETGREDMRLTTARLRERRAAEIAGRRVTRIDDYMDDNTRGDLPKSDMLRFRADGGATVTVRPSGTEPKIKVYYEARGADMAEANRAIAECSAAMRQMLH
jgi:phosphoglucomutase